jgi:hypothetical protein
MKNKNAFIGIKNYLYFLRNTTMVLAVVLFISCEKSDFEPPLADLVMGELLATSHSIGKSAINLIFNLNP